jgi:outer membrane protein assembly factor BamB
MNIVFACFCAFLPTLHAENWPSWRGPRGDGSSIEKGIPVTWSATQNIAWKAPLAVKGHSSPIVWGNNVYLTGCDEQTHERAVMAFDLTTGKQLWKQVCLVADLEKKHPENSFSSATPATDGAKVYVSFLAYPQVHLFCYSVSGELLWRANPGPLLSRHGFCSSPMLFGNTVILNCDQDGDGYIVALDKTTGKQQWRIARPNKTRSYCTPFFFEDPDRPGKTQMVLSGSKCVASYDAATGEQLWLYPGPTEQYVASPVRGKDGVLFLSTGFPEFHLMGFRSNGRGTIGKEHVAWHIHHRDNGPKGAAYVPSPIAYKDWFYVVSDVGYIGCNEGATGKRLWLEKLGKHHHASPVLVNDRIYVPDDSGTTWVLKAGPVFEVLAKNELKEEIYASPAISQGRLLLRSRDQLWCVFDPAGQ